MLSQRVDIRQLTGDEALRATLQLLRTRSSRYAWFGTFIASCAVILACMLVAQHFHDGISYETMLRVQRENVAIWVLDTMPFIFAVWGQVVSFRTTQDAGSAIMMRTSSLRRRLRKERASARLRTDYFAKLSHEFRTPLNSILGLTDILLQKAEAKAVENDIRVIHGAAENLLTLINDVLDYSAIEAGHVELDRVEFDLRECVTNACMMLRPQALAKGLALDVDIQPGVPHAVTGDPGRLRQIIVNLISNAIKFTEAGSVRCRVTHVSGDGSYPHHVAVAVSDTGRGIDARGIRRLFTPYRRDDHRVEGTGLGLAICRELAEAMGGDISVASEPGKGSVFTAHLQFERQQGISLARIARGIELRGIRLLLVEPPSEERSRFEAQLRALGLEVRIADDGVEALKDALLGCVHGRPYELLITDLFVEHLSGEGLARALKSRMETRDICLVATTATGSRGDGQRVRKAGFSGYLTKPIPPEHLGDLLRATLATLAFPRDSMEAANIITRHYIRENVPREVSVLLVEDEAVSMASTRNRLESLGCRVTGASSAADALHVLVHDEFHLALLDYNLPDGRGDEVARNIIDHLGSSPIIMFSAGLTQAERQRCLRAGAVGFLEKPATREGLLSVLERYCRPPVEAMDDLEAAVTPALRSVFVRESLTRIAELQKATGSTLDTSIVHRIAHTMRSSARHVGAESLSALFAELDSIAAAGSEKAIRAKAAEALAHWREVVAMMEDSRENNAQDRTERLLG